MGTVPAFTKGTALNAKPWSFTLPAPDTHANDGTWTFTITAEDQAGHTDSVTKTATATGSVTIPSGNVDGVPIDPDDPEEEPVVIGSTEEQTVNVSLPVSWTEDGQAVVTFIFEFNDDSL